VIQIYGFKIWVCIHSQLSSGLATSCFSQGFLVYALASKRLAKGSTDLGERVVSGEELGTYSQGPSA
jgi:hypothetical protein